MTTETPRPKKPWPAFVASFMMNDMAGICRKRGLTVERCGIPAGELGYLLQLEYEGHIDRRDTRESVHYMLDRAAAVEAEVRDVMNFCVEYALNNA